MDLNSFVKKHIDSELSKINTSFIGKIVSINENKTINIQPVIKRNINNQAIDIPVIEDVEFLQNFSSSGYSALKFDIDDYVLCISLQRDHSNFFANLSEDVAPTRRQFNISDIVALPFFYSNTEHIEDEIKGFDIFNKSNIKLNFNDIGIFEMNEDGVKFEYNNVDILSLLSDTLDALSIATVATSSGLQPLSNASTYSLLKQKIDSIKQ